MFISCLEESGCKIVSVIHYLADPHKKYAGNVIHTVIADSISMEELSEQEGLTLLRDTMATWYFYLMEKYVHSICEELLEGFETASDVWESVADIHNIQISNATHVQYAGELVAREKRQDFQRRF